MATKKQIQKLATEALVATVFQNHAKNSLREAKQQLADAKAEKALSHQKLKETLAKLNPDESTWVIQIPLKRFSVVVDKATGVRVVRKIKAKSSFQSAKKS